MAFRYLYHSLVLRPQHAYRPPTLDTRTDLQHHSTAILRRRGNRAWTIGLALTATLVFAAFSVRLPSYSCFRLSWLTCSSIKLAILNTDAVDQYLDNKFYEPSPPPPPLPPSRPFLGWSPTESTASPSSSAPSIQHTDIASSPQHSTDDDTTTAATISTPQQSSDIPAPAISPPEDSPAHQVLHLLVPATQPDIHLCRLLLTTSALAYPEPVLINYGKTFSDPDLLAGGSHLAKITGVLEWLTALRDDQQEDLVLVADAYDVWFQLPPSTLIARYHAANAAADARMADHFGAAAPPTGFHQTVIFAADKRCSPQNYFEPDCYMQPDSTLRADLYGEYTDTTDGWDWNHSYRPRYLNSGFVMGSVRDLRRVLDAAAVIIADQLADPELYPDHPAGSDQFAYNIVFMQQQLQRETLAAQIAANSGLVYDVHDSMGLVPEGQEEGRDALSLELGPDYDLGIGIDYTSALTHTTVGSHRDWQYLHYATSPPWPPLNMSGQYDCHTDVQPLPPDISSATPPFAALAGTNSVAAAKTWADVALYTNLCSGQIPVTIHHNGDKGAREAQWTSLWMQSRALALLAARRNQSPEGAREAQRDGSLFFSRSGSAGDDDEALNAGDAVTEAGLKLGWTDLCIGKGYEELLFEAQAP